MIGKKKPEAPDLSSELAHWKQRAEKAEAELAKLAKVPAVACVQGGLLHWTQWIKFNHPVDMKLYPVAVPAKEEN